MKKVIPILLRVFWHAINEPDFKKLLYELFEIELRWMAEELGSQEAFDLIIKKIAEYFGADLE